MHNHTCSYWYGGNGAQLSLPLLFAGNFGHLAARHLASCRTGGRRWLLFSPAFLILWAPAGFRFTCYYYRGAYYKAFWADPIACAVGEPRKRYLGEKSFPAHHSEHPSLFLLCGGCCSSCSLPMMPGRACGSRTRDGQGTFWHRRWHDRPDVNVFFWAVYTFGCHSLRHLVGGFLD